MRTAATIHASCVVLGEAGLLIRGPAGAGKSTLARTLIAAAQGCGRFGRLVCDDRVRIEAVNGRLKASALAAIAGRIEVRGIGLLPVAYEKAVVVRLVIDCLSEEPPRFPEPAERTATLLGVTLPRFAHRAAGGPPAIDLLGWGDVCDTVMAQ